MSYTITSKALVKGSTAVPGYVLLSNGNFAVNTAASLFLGQNTDFIYPTTNGVSGQVLIRGLTGTLWADPVGRTGPTGPSGTTGPSGGTGVTGSTGNSFVGNSSFVDAVFGNDTTGTRERFDLPYATLQKATFNSLSGDTVFVRPGIYNIPTLTGLGVSNVNYYFDPGCTAIFNGGTATAIFQSPVKVTGYANMSCSTPLFNTVLDNNDYFEFNNLVVDNTVAFTNTTGGGLVIYCRGEIIIGPTGSTATLFKPNIATSAICSQNISASSIIANSTNWINFIGTPPLGSTKPFELNCNNITANATPLMAVNGGICIINTNSMVISSGNGFTGTGSVNINANSINSLTFTDKTDLFGNINNLGSLTYTPSDNLRSVYLNINSLGDLFLSNGNTFGNVLSINMLSGGITSINSYDNIKIQEYYMGPTSVISYNGSTSVFNVYNLICGATSDTVIYDQTGGNISIDLCYSTNVKRLKFNNNSICTIEADNLQFSNNTYDMYLNDNSNNITLNVNADYMSSQATATYYIGSTGTTLYNNAYVYGNTGNGGLLLFNNSPSNVAANLYGRYVNSNSSLIGVSGVTGTNPTVIVKSVSVIGPTAINFTGPGATATLQLQGTLALTNNLPDLNIIGNTGVYLSVNSLYT